MSKYLFKVNNEEARIIPIGIVLVLICLENRVKNFKMEFFAKIVNNFQSLTIFAKSSILDVGQSLEYACLLSRLLILN